MKSYYLNIKENDTWVMIYFNELKIEIITEKEKFCLKNHGHIHLSEHGFDYKDEDFYDLLNICLYFDQWISLPHHSYWGHVHGHLHVNHIDMTFKHGHVYFEERRKDSFFIHAMCQDEIVCFHRIGKRILKGYWKIGDRLYCTQPFYDWHNHYRQGQSILEMVFRPQKCYGDQMDIRLVKKGSVLREAHFDHVFYQGTLK